jgi:altronate hydrolase
MKSKKLMMNDFIKINPKDNVAVAIFSAAKGSKVVLDEREIEIVDDIPVGHKVALVNLEAGENIIKYGEPIGHVTEWVKCGMHVHSHNLKTNLSGTLTYEFNQKLRNIPSNKEQRTFKGYLRLNGEVGIRNELWVVPTVGCVNGQAQQIIDRFKASVNPQGIDNVEVFKHNYGCSQLGDDHVNTKTALADLVKHPNAGGVLVLSLGCENLQMDEFRSALGDFDSKRVRFLKAQEVNDEIAEGVSILTELYHEMSSDKRVDLPISKLRIGLKCGGSDGFSGITANPLLGAFSDYLVAAGGTTVLTEVPEMFGAENILMERAADKDVFLKTVNLINDFKDYFNSYNQPIYENPSPGNKAGGITTLEEKSLGCTQKCGNAIVVDVLKYGERINKNGLNLLSASGNDLVASSALAFSGCQMVLFTTGRGTPFGSFVPTMKISTNSALFEKKRHWIDFNAGSLLDGISMTTLLKVFTDYIIKVASGELLNHENAGFKEMAIFKSGVTL